MNVALSVLFLILVSVGTVSAASGDVVHIKDEKDFK